MATLIPPCEWCKYFTLKYCFLRQSVVIGHFGSATKNASFIHNQISESKIKKGARLSIVGRVVQQRWKQDDKTRTKIVIIAEHIAYAVTSGAKPANGSTTSSDAKETTSASAASVPDSF